jgi:hypothetical protein
MKRLARKNSKAITFGRNRAAVFGGDGAFYLWRAVN